MSLFRAIPDGGHRSNGRAQKRGSLERKITNGGCGTEHVLDDLLVNARGNFCLRVG